MTIDGNGRASVFYGRMQPFTLEPCRNVTVRNIGAVNMSRTEIRVGPGQAIVQ